MTGVQTCALPILERDDIYIATMEEMVVTFIAEVNEVVAQLRNKIQEKKNGASVSK